MIRPRSRSLSPRPITRFVTRAVTAAATASLVALAAVPAQRPATAESPSTESVVMTSATATATFTYEKRVQRLVNIRRANHGLPRLRLASCPDTTAERWSRHLAMTDAFYHQSMTNVLDRCNARYAGETLGRGSMPPRRLVRMWMESPGHRDILLSRQSRRIGIGASRDVFGRWVVAANFVRF